MSDVVERMEVINREIAHLEGLMRRILPTNIPALSATEKAIERLTEARMWAHEALAVEHNG